MEVTSEFISLLILALLVIGSMVLYYVRKRMVGEILGTASSSRVRFIYLALSLILVVQKIYFAFNYPGYISNVSVYGMISNLILVASFLTLFFTSRIHIGLKGVSVPIFPFFLPRNQITDFEMFSNELVLKRKGKEDFKIAIEINDVKNIESIIRQIVK